MAHIAHSSTNFRKQRRTHPESQEPRQNARLVCVGGGGASSDFIEPPCCASHRSKDKSASAHGAVLGVCHACSQFKEWILTSQRSATVSKSITGKSTIDNDRLACNITRRAHCKESHSAGDFSAFADPFHRSSTIDSRSKFLVGK